MIEIKSSWTSLVYIQASDKHSGYQKNVMMRTLIIDNCDKRKFLTPN